MRRLLAAVAVSCLAALGLASPAAARDWYVAETNNFIVKSEDDEEGTRQFAIELERFDMALRTLQNLPIGEDQPTRATKLTVYRFGDVSDIGRMAGVNGLAGFYIPRAGDSVAFTPAREQRRRSMSVTNPERRRRELQRLDAVSVLQHEYVHYFMMQHFPAAYPAWYVEGYAELLATIRFNEDGSFHVGDPPQYRAYQIFQMRQFPLEDMLDAEHKLGAREAYQFYGTGWLLAHYLNFNRYEELNEYLTAIGQGEDSLEAARRIFGDLDAIDRELLSYRSGNFPGYSVRPEGYVEPTVSLRAVTEIEEALIQEEMRLRRGVDKDEAASIASKIRSTMGSSSSDLYALNLLTRAEYNAENYEAAEAAARRVLEIDQDSFEGNLMMGFVAIERIEDDPNWAETAREYALKAASLDIDDPRARVAYYYSYLKERQEPTENAIIALEGAYDHAGSDPAYRIFLARQLIAENSLDTAETVLLPIAFRGHNQGDDEEDADEEDNNDPPSLDDILDAIKADDRDLALSQMDELIHWEPEEE